MATYNNDENKDRLSDLPNCVLLHILSYLNTKEAVQTCILSSRWIDLWKHLSTLNLNYSHFNTMRNFTKFVSHILSFRDNSTALFALDFHRDMPIKYSQLLRILNYSAKHNVQRLQLFVVRQIEYFPPRSFSCHTLTSLNLTFNHRICQQGPIFPNSLNLPALNTLSLNFFVFRGNDDDCCYVEPFSTFKSLNSLNILDCILLGEKLNISNDTLVNLKIETFPYEQYKIDLSTPSLCNFDFRSIPVHNLCMSKNNLSSIKHVNIDITTVMREIPAETSLILLKWLQDELANIESLSVTYHTLQILSLVPHLLKVDFTSLHNLKSLTVKAGHLSSIPDGVVDFLLQNAPSVKPDIILIRRKHDNPEEFEEYKLC